VWSKKLLWNVVIIIGYNNNYSTVQHTHKENAPKLRGSVFVVVGFNMNFKKHVSVVHKEVKEADEYIE